VGLTFAEILTQAIAMLQRLGRVSYRALTRQFQLDDDLLALLKDDIVAVHRLARNSHPHQSRHRHHGPTPHLAEKILTSRGAIEGERKQVMVLFGAFLAHEDHAVWACYAALAMQAVGQQYAAEVQRQHGVPVQLRVGCTLGKSSYAPLAAISIWITRPLTSTSWPRPAWAWCTTARETFGRCCT
jgi:hypothetical protein